MNSFYKMLSDNVQNHAEQTAILYDTNGITYGMMLEDIKKKAVHFQQFPGKRVALYGPASYRWIVNFFGVVLAGKDVILFDYFRPAAARKRILNKIGADYTLSSTNQYVLADMDGNTIPDAEKELGDVSRFQQAQEGNVLLLTATAKEADKAVALTTANLMNTVKVMSGHCHCGQEDRVIAMLYLHHIFGLVYSLLWPLTCGACVCVGRGLRHVDYDTIYYRPTIFPATPAMAAYVLHRRAVNEEMRKIVIGGADCPNDLYRALCDLHLRVYTVYGMTECSGCIGINKHGTGSCYSLYDGTSLQVDASGELLISGACVMAGYDRDEAGTAEVLRDGVYHTGDYGYRDKDDNLVITRRNPGIILLETGEKICRQSLIDQVDRIDGVREAYACLYKGKLTVILVPLKEDMREEILKRRIQEFNRAHGYCWEIQEVIFWHGELPRHHNGLVDEAHLFKKLEREMA